MLLMEREEENKRKEFALQRMAEEAEQWQKAREEHEVAMVRAKEQMREKEEQATSQIKLLHQSLAMATEAYEMKQKQWEAVRLAPTADAEVVCIVI